MLGVSAARVSKIERQPGAVSLDNLLDVLRLLGARLKLVDHAKASAAARADHVQSTGTATPATSLEHARGSNLATGEW